jgi:hypothetical protein
MHPMIEIVQLLILLQLLLMTGAELEQTRANPTSTACSTRHGGNNPYRGLSPLTGAAAGARENDEKTTGAEPMKKVEPVTFDLDQIESCLLAFASGHAPNAHALEYAFAALKRCGHRPDNEAAFKDAIQKMRTTSPNP